MLRLILKEKEGVVCCPIYHIYRQIGRAHV